MEFLKGVDISSLPEHLDGGEVFYTGDGRCMEPFDLLEEYGINAVRLRLWNEPALAESSGGYCDMAHTIPMARRVKEKGMHFLLDFHYSDSWADPEKQRKPHAWEGLSYEELKRAVHDFTRQSLDELAAQGLLPDMVQVGNEITNGMLFPDGEVPAYDRLVGLLNEGIRAVRETSPDIAVMLHLEQGGRFYFQKTWFDAMFAAGLEPIDAIGLSYYSFWHGTFMGLKNSIKQLTARYRVPVYVVETAHPWRHCEKEHVSEAQLRPAGLPAGKEEQKRSQELVMQIAAQASGDYPTGIFYWEPLCLPGKTYGSWAENMSMVDERGRVLCGFDAYRDFDPENPPIDDLDDYLAKLYAKEGRRHFALGRNLVLNEGIAEEHSDWYFKNLHGEVTVKSQGKELFVDGRSDFGFDLYSDVYITAPGSYKISAEYLGTNAAGAKVELFLRIYTGDGLLEYTQPLASSEYFAPQSLVLSALPVGQVQLGIRMNTPPMTARLRNLSFERIYHFKGCETARNVTAENRIYPGIETPLDLYAALESIWCADTCAPRMRHEWTPENRTLGQCSITAFLAQDIFGGEVYGMPTDNGGVHCYNVVDGYTFDLTSEQFGERAGALVYEGNERQERESAMHFAKEEKRRRYEYLKSRLLSETR